MSSAHYTVCPLCGNLYEPSARHECVRPATVDHCTHGLPLGFCGVNGCEGNPEQRRKVVAVGHDRPSSNPERIESLESRIAELERKVARLERGVF